MCIVDSGSSSAVSRYFHYSISSFDFTADNSIEDALDHGVSTLSVSFFLLCDT